MNRARLEHNCKRGKKKAFYPVNVSEGINNKNRLEPVQIVILFEQCAVYMHGDPNFQPWGG